MIIFHYSKVSSFKVLTEYLLFTAPEVMVTRTKVLDYFFSQKFQPDHIFFNKFEAYIS